MVCAAREIGTLPTDDLEVAAKMNIRQTTAAAVLGIWTTISLVAASAVAGERDVAELLDGVAEIGAPGVPGPLCVFGEKAFPVVAGGSGDHREPVVAAARMGKGRVVAFGHTDYLDGRALERADTGRLVENAVRWAAGTMTTKPAKIRVAVRQKRGLADFLRKRGIEAESLEGTDWQARLGQFDVLCCGTGSRSDRSVAALAEFINGGGGLVAADLGWGWLQLNRGKDLSQHPGNRVLAPAGILWADGHLERTSAGGFAATGAPSPLLHAARALDAVASSAGGKAAGDSKDIAQAVAVVTRAARSLPPDDKLFRPQLRALQEKHKTAAIPTRKRPITDKQPLGRLLLTLQIEETKDLPPDQTKADPAAAEFPGTVPADAKKVARSVPVNTEVPRWHSTGLYAAPGQVITVETPETAAGKGLRLRIGAHTDRLWNKTSWRRAPEITRRVSLDEPITRAANAFGGPIYIDVPDNCELGTVSITIRDAVEAPHYIHGKTDLAEWRKTIRHRPAPWAELETSKVILTLPSEVVRDLDDPKTLMDFWNDVMDACAELAAWPLERRYPERYVADVQISAGYMHAGYPIMTLLDMPAVMVDRDRILSNGHGGVWGLFHETGHNHQSRDWTFGGTGEVTVNLFSLYVFDKVIGMPSGQAHGSISPRSRARKLQRYFAGDTRDFTQWKRDPFLALIMYMQIQEAFGWEPYKKVIAEYRALPRRDRPRTDNDKRDQWMVRLSRTVGRNLGPFFQTWGVPTSEKARSSIADLPVWMPDDFPPKPAAAE